MTTTASGEANRVTHAAWYPKASRIQDRSQFSGINMPRITKLLLHSTETRGWPGYPTFAPQFTYDPWNHQWRQHMRLPLSASTLADPSWTAVRENRDDIVQVEIIGYCDPARWPAYGHNVEKMDARALRELGEFAAWLADEWELPIRESVDWISYPKSYGVNAAQRLSGSEFDAYRGILGHQHASGNSHGDPGKINIAAIIAAATQGEDEDVALSAEDKRGVWAGSDVDFLTAPAGWTIDGKPVQPRTLIEKTAAHVAALEKKIDALVEAHNHTEAPTP